PAAASRRSLQACIASLPLQSSLMSKTYLKSDHFSGGGSEAYREAIAEVIVIKCEQFKRALTIEIEALRRELDAARAEIASLRGDANQICSWSIDRKNYRVTPFLPGGKPGVTLDLRQLFEQYRFDTSD